MIAFSHTRRILAQGCDSFALASAYWLRCSNRCGLHWARRLRRRVLHLFLFVGTLCRIVVDKDKSGHVNTLYWLHMHSICSSLFQASGGDSAAGTLIHCISVLKGEDVRVYSFGVGFALVAQPLKDSGVTTQISTLSSFNSQ